MRVTAHCECGSCTAVMLQMPKHRLFCHCSVCQSVYNGPFSDVVVTSASMVSLPDKTPLIFGAHKSWPAINRGTCPDCASPVVGFMTYGPGLRAAYVSRRALGDQAAHLTPKFHLFYKTRQADIDDDLPKYHGDLASMIAATPMVMAAMLGR